MDPSVGLGEEDIETVFVLLLDHVGQDFQELKRLLLVCSHGLGVINDENLIAVSSDVGHTMGDKGNSHDHEQPST